jgi:hypothetical protein
MRPPIGDCAVGVTGQIDVFGQRPANLQADGTQAAHAAIFPLCATLRLHDNHLMAVIFVRVVTVLAVPRELARAALGLRPPARVKR